jgi:hypothetical protein
MFGAKTMGISCAAASMDCLPSDRKAGGADHQADAMAPAGLQVLQGAFRPGKVDQAVGNRQGGIEVGVYPDTARRADQFPGILAEKRTAGVLERG